MATLVYRSINATADVDLAVAADDKLVLMGVAVSETAGTPAVAEVLIINGADGDAAAAGTVFPVFLPASSTISQWFETGIPCPDGITVERIAGETNVVLYYRYV